MPRTETRDTARQILEIIPVVMRTVAAELRSAGEMPAPAHFGLLTILGDQPRTLTELALLQGVSLPTMSNSISTLVQRGWVKRSSPAKDRRVVLIEVTPLGRATVERVGKAAEAHLSERLGTLDAASRRRLRAGLGVLRAVFADAPPAALRSSRRTSARTPASNG
ncbi:MAG: MarR family transcriptional regulator [Acidobacteria bacterium]|nr:MarR family transcriptional regulator [Acidobacteriota bacterium]